MAGLKTKTSLKSKAHLTASKPLKARPKSKAAKHPKPKLRPVSKLIKDADKAFSHYVRLRDSELVAGEWVGRCISCPKKYVVYRAGKWTNFVDNGHFVGRGHHVTRYEEENCNLQCKRCNKWLGGNYTKYRFALNEKYGAGTAAKLELMAQSTPVYNFKREELEQIISDAKTQIEFYLNSQ